MVKVLVMIGEKQTVFWKGIGIIFVVAGHLGIIPLGGAMGVAVFLVVSGYGLEVSCCKKKDFWVNFWKRRISKVWVPYAVWSSAILLCGYCLKIETVRNIPFRNILLILFCIRPDIGIDPTMWYITYIMALYLAFYVSHRTMKVFKILICSLCSVMACMYNCFPPGAGVFLYVLCFPIGLLAGRFCAKREVSLEEDRWTGIPELVVSTIITIYMYKVNDSNMGYMLFVLSFSCTIVIWMSYINRTIVLVDYIGRASFTIYLCEGICLQVYNHYFGIGNIFYNLLCFIVIIAIGEVLDFMWRKFYILLRNIAYSYEKRKE